MKYEIIETDDLGMEMPTPCEFCSKVFDLNDGHVSPRRPGVVICADCARSQQEEVDREEEINNLMTELEDAEYTVKSAKDRLAELQGAPIVSATLAAKVGYDLVAHLHRQRAFSLKAFGPESRAKGVVAHIRKELTEIEADPTDLTEWIDVALLAFDGAWRAGHTPEEIVVAFNAKLAKNEAREWPDWRTRSGDEPIEHVKPAGGNDEAND